MSEIPFYSGKNPTACRIQEYPSWPHPEINSFELRVQMSSAIHSTTESVAEIAILTEFDPKTTIE